MKDSHYFVLSRPVRKLAKTTDSIKKAPTGQYEEETDYAGSHSRVFQRLGLDLIQVNDDGTATVHARPDLFKQLEMTSNILQEAGAREQARWATIDDFGIIPPGLRLDEPWFRTLTPGHLVDGVIELQPLLSRVEIDAILRAIAGLLNKAPKERLKGTGADFSGRQWLRGSLTPASLRQIARTFYSVQSLHSPLVSIAAGKLRQAVVANAPLHPAEHPPLGLTTLPTVGVLDTGVPTDHIHLSQYRRGRYQDPDCAGGALGDHGSFVSSRVVYGDMDQTAALSDQPKHGQCGFYDIGVALNAQDINDKSVVPAIAAVIATAPDVRVFNLSFDDRIPLAGMSEIRRREKLLLVQDLDNLVFARDAVIVVASGNTARGVAPVTPYPDHADDEAWGLGPWACGFNTLTCGSYVGRLAADGLAKQIGWPSPFARVGPGLCESTKPDFSEHGGNCSDRYALSPGTGVWGCTANGTWEDRPGTSYAAPLLAREAAIAGALLQRVCDTGALPFGVTIKAFLALAADPPVTDARIKDLIGRTLGRGRASAARLLRPNADTAILIWQGTLASHDDVARVTVPIPRAWTKLATHPVLRLVACWDSPVNQAAHDVWACRKVDIQLRPGVDMPALHGTKARHRSYPWIDRRYDLNRLPDGVKIEGETWLLEISYKQIADYYPAIDFAPQQRIAFAAELYDESEKPVSPQTSLQALPIAATMQRLSIPPTAARTPVIIRSRA